MRFLLLLLLVGCSDAHAAVTPKKQKLPLSEQLALEARSRPKRAVRVEQLVEALAKRSVVIERHRQVLAGPIDAAYCETMTTDKGLALSLCEYGDDDAAARGRALSKRTFDRMIPGRTLDLRFNSLLTATGPSDERAIARDVFARLEPR